ERADLAAVIDRDARLVAAARPRPAEWWFESLEPFVLSGKRQAVFRKPRRVGASTLVFPRVAVASAITLSQFVPAGQIGTIANFSVRREEAGNRLRNLTDTLDVLGLPYDQAGDAIELRDLPVVFKVMTASFRTAVGELCLMLWCDELARWSEDGQNPASEVVAAAKPALATIPGARVFLVSSPLSTLDYHAQCFDQGDTDGQMVFACPPTWEVNPQVTEEECHALEPEPGLFDNNFRGLPRAPVSAAFPADEIDPAFRALEPPLEVGAGVGIVDFSSGRSDAATWAVARWAWPPTVSPYLTTRERVSFRDPATGEIRRELREFPLTINRVPQPNPAYTGPKPPLFVLEGVHGVEGTFWQSLPASELVARMARAFIAAGVSYVIADQREAYLLQSEFGRHGLRFIALNWDNANKQAAVERLRRWFHERTIVFPDQPPHEKLRRELHGFAEKITASGAITYGARGAAHDDYAALCLTAAMASAEHLIPADPLAPRRRTFRLPPGIVL
ncbi:MAG TPA: hypothetical protein PLU22_24170, partial [Polyangiaceae bacterium]|nr:hypothetical protein [Polyangiaceae bacterium]